MDLGPGCPLWLILAVIYLLQIILSLHPSPQHWTADKEPRPGVMAAWSPLCGVMGKVVSILNVRGQQMLSSPLLTQSALPGGLVPPPAAHSKSQSRGEVQTQFSVALFWSQTLAWVLVVIKALPISHCSLLNCWLIIKTSQNVGKSESWVTAPPEPPPLGTCLTLLEFTL